MHEEPLVSIVVLLKEFFHLANMTLKSIIDQTDNSYEIIVIETAETKRDLMMLKPYSEKIREIVHFDEYDLSQLMNKGLDLAKGKYIHFLFSGDVYVSKYMIAYLNKLIVENNYPKLISCALLRRDEISCPEAINFSEESLKKGKIPMNIQSCWLSVEGVKKFNGFDPKYKIQVGFDMICKFFIENDKKIIFSNRVLTDYQLKKRPSKVVVYAGWENLKIIFRNLGLIKTLYLWIVHDYFRMLKLVSLTIKKAFWNP